MEGVAHGPGKRSSAIFRTVSPSTVGVGTTVSVFLPAVQGTTTELPIISKQRRLGLRPASVLLVEDEEQVRRLISRILTKHGFVVHEATNGTEALALAERLDEMVDLVISDVVMPNMSGPVAAREILKKFPGKPVVFISGYAQSESLVELLAMSTVRFLPKPFSPTELLSTINDILGMGDTDAPSERTRR